ncbi:MAG: N-acetyltransferase family protein [Mucilaginibacter sp.]|uniref:GNAT family N-acetyltransferase n=1 Tax=Mucilaginibacter sp. TaxID=1882438 RepID=UPI0031B27C92
MASVVNIRNAQEDDLLSILHIYNDAILNTTSVYSEEPHTIEMRQAWYQERLNNGFPVLVAEAAGKVVGFCSYGHFRAWPCYRFTIEHSVYVDPEFRGQGISKLLLRPLIHMAQQNNIHAMIAGIDSENQVSYHLHQSLGFRQVAHFKEVGFKFNRWLDLLFMELLLDE